MAEETQDASDPTKSHAFKRSTIPAAAAVATALSASFSKHASTVCISVSVTTLDAVKTGRIVSSSTPKQTLGNR